MYEGNPGEIDFGSSQCKVRVIESRLYFYFTKIGEPLVTLLFLVFYLNINLSTISPYCLYFTFLVKTWLGGGSLPFFLLVKKGDCLKILYDLGPDLKKFCPFKKYPLLPPPPAICLMNAALCDVLYKQNERLSFVSEVPKISWQFASRESYNLEILDHSQLADVKNEVEIPLVGGKAKYWKLLASLNYYFLMHKF